MLGQHGGEVAEFVVDVFGAAHGFGNSVADRLAPSLAEAVEVGAHTIMGAAFHGGDFLEGGIPGIGENPWPEDRQPLAGGGRSVFEGEEGQAEDMLRPVAIICLGVHAGWGNDTISRSFLMGGGTDGVQGFELAVAAADTGAGAPVVVAEEIIEDGPQVGAETRGEAFPLRLVGQEMSLFPGEAEGEEFRDEVVDVGFWQKRPLMADVVAQWLRVGDEQAPEDRIGFRCRAVPKCCQSGVVGFRPAITPFIWARWPTMACSVRPGSGGWGEHWHFVAYAPDRDPP